MSALQALVGVSRVSHVPSVSEIGLLPTRAQRPKAPHGLTGIWLYSAFAQSPEGPAAPLSQVDRIVRAGRLHHGIIERLRQTLVRREFPDWAMACRSTDAWVDPSRTASSIRTVVAAGLSRPALYDELRLPGAPAWAARTNPAAFWNRARQPAAR